MSHPPHLLRQNTITAPDWLYLSTPTCSSSCASCSTIVSTCCPKSIGFISPATPTKLSPAACRTSAWLSPKSLVSVGSTVCKCGSSIQVAGQFAVGSYRRFTRVEVEFTANPLDQEELNISTGGATAFTKRRYRKRCIGIQSMGDRSPRIQMVELLTRAISFSELKSVLSADYILRGNHR